MISDPCCACDINPFTAISPAIGTSVRTATDCAGTKKAETTLIVNRMTYITYRSCTNTSASTSTPRIRSLAIIVRFKCHRSDDRQRRHKRYQHHRHLRRRTLQLKRHHRDDREHRQEVPEHADNLRD